jgi:hypothetical protein
LKIMTTANGIANTRTARKSLADQIDRLDNILDGLAESLNESVADAVKDVIAQVVGRAVETAVKEVLSSPELLHAALEKHAPPAPSPQSAAPKTDRRSITDSLKRGWSWLCGEATQAASHVKKTLGQGMSWCAEKVHKCFAALWNRRQGWVAACAGALTAMGGVGLALWQFRWSCSIALAAGLLVGLCGYLAGPVFCALLSGLGGMAATLSAMLLLPFWKFLRSSNASNTLD